VKWGSDWRKLYRHPSRQWLNLPASVRGLGDELIRVVEDDGRVYVGADVLVGVMRAIEAHPSERQWVKAALARLVADGFCAVDGDHLAVRNFVVAQSAVGASAERMRRHRANAGATTPAPGAGAGLGPSTTGAGTEHDGGTTGAGASLEPGAGDSTTRKDTGADVTVTSPKEEKRSEEKRSEEKRRSSSTNESAGARDPALPDPAKFTDPWAVARFLRDRSAGRIELTLLGTGERELLAALKQLAAGGWGFADLATWAEASRHGGDGWQGEYALGQLLGAPEPDGRRPCRGLAKCLETSRSWARAAAAREAEKARQIAAHEAAEKAPSRGLHPLLKKLAGGAQ